MLEFKCQCVFPLRFAASNFQLFPFFLSEASTVQETLADGVHKLEKSIENLNIRLARLLAEYSASQAKLKQRIAKLEMW